MSWSKGRFLLSDRFHVAYLLIHERAYITYSRRKQPLHQVEPTASFSVFQLSRSRAHAPTGLLSLDFLSVRMAASCAKHLIISRARSAVFANHCLSDRSESAQVYFSRLRVLCAIGHLDVDAGVVFPDGLSDFRSRESREVTSD